ncbi:MAG: bifunctional 4-hydroxy-2-oxoglutarate aldolase/2-dehydro-3-deoxy-phosphogluconate aldolase [Gammaproteobacteria bacterium]|nr:MAG: bifunctional 4-hydroxy-2-oxoglutarate aldolase/2-dehydro-3-deoxy-phosphogluconate aldolase [Gammaproteobacteria bacterium]
MSASFRELFPEPTVIAVLSIGEPELAVDVASALARGGLDSIELTLRVPGAMQAAQAVRDALPDVRVGIGTVTRSEQLAQAADIGADFAVSPGLDEQLALAAGELPYLPGVATPSELMRATALGFTELKVFPIATLGGPAFLAQLAPVFPQLRFCPTGGIREQDLPDYLAAPGVFAVGGGWLAPAPLIAARDWAAIEALAARACAACAQARR